ncbi:hypothetical protein Despr_0489 [Desulfobulbus propionicus DSM 2032]|uniref:Acetyltransferase n=1 Tax=Desulfobulbus propionicus (strain ATCC 33891 / DSM 2032 / VKM B-1956 / 1pr3) TaxID=577650 RepID=A0A7U3YJS3_DESPD|nr:hypothetical protein [Desulfobulbus propionicus]ADW16669.1 hypothetical protein Despr_0489 [Desulfobulbus propionicus DSM 2032]
MNCIDVFNGDADGICALHQLRLHIPQPEARLVTGVKRDIALLDRLAGVHGHRITVLDVSLDRNRAALERLLGHDNRILYVDHHYSGAVPESDALEVHIDPSPLLCTSLIVDRLLQGAYRPWALVGAFGDNLDEVAQQQAQDTGLDDARTAVLKDIGRLLNYNGYGLVEEDLLVHPADLYREVHRFADPFAFGRDSTLLAALRRGYGEDMRRAADLAPYRTSTSGRVFLLPTAAWSKRVVGVFANQLSREQPEQAHATVLPQADGSYLISVRAPLATRLGADNLCRQFPTGGGRAAAAGINRLPERELERFLDAFARHFA